MSTKNAIVLSLSAVAIVLVAIVAILIGSSGKTEQKCAEAKDAYSAAKVNAQNEITSADTVLQFMNDTDLHGFMDSETGSALTRTVNARKAEIDLNAATTCDSDHEAKLLTRKAEELNEGAANLNKAVKNLSDGMNAHIGKQVTAKTEKLNKSVDQAKKEVNAAIKNANETTGYRSSGDAGNLIAAAESALKALNDDPGLPKTISSMEDIVKANDALANRQGQRDSAMKAADELQQSVTKYVNDAKKAREEAERASEEASIQEEEQKQEQQKKAEEARKCWDNCSDILVTGKNCAGYSEIRYLQSNGWTIDEALNAARNAQCQSVSVASNPCSECQ